MRDTGEALSAPGADGNADIKPLFTYEELVSEVLDAVGLVPLPSPADGWTELPDLLAEGEKRGFHAAQTRHALDVAIKNGTQERVKSGRRIFYRTAR